MLSELSCSLDKISSHDKNYTVESLQNWAFSLSSILVRYLLNPYNKENDEKITLICKDVVKLYKPIENVLATEKEWKLFHKLMPYKRII